MYNESTPSRACEIASYEDLDKLLQELDQEFTGTVAKVLENLKNWKQIEPVRTYLIEEDYEMTGLGVCCDGGLPAYGTSCYVMSQDPTTGKLASTKSRFSKRTIAEQEALARPLSIELAKKVYRG